MSKKLKIAIADSGGTNTKWLFDLDGEHSITIETDGLHPKELSEAKLKQLATLLASIKIEEFDLHFYGSGCGSEENKSIISNFLNQVGFSSVSVYSDLLGSCRATLGNKMGNVAILGTGAVGAHYSGENIVITTSGLGYLIGDEGSGFDLGRKLLKLYFAKELDSKINLSIEEYFNGADNIISTIYNEGGRKKIAGLSKIIRLNDNSPKIRNLINTTFEEFYRKTILPLPKLDSIHLTGGIAHFFEDELRKLLLENNVAIKSILRNPSEQLLEHHKTILKLID